MPQMRSNTFRDKVIILAVGGAISLVLLVIGGYQLYEFTESNEFCGELCHTVMRPEYVVYQASPHSNVKCVECHVGPGAGYLVKTKIAGIGQVFATLFNTYDRPLGTPVENLRPATDTCEQCHRPGIFSGDLLRTNMTFESNEANTEHVVNMVLKVGAGGESTARDIHWHVAAKVWYLPADEKRSEISWIGVETDSGIVDYFNPTFSGTISQQLINENKRLMDCIDCHNRATHIFKSPEELVDEAMTEGRIDRTLPYIKREALKALGVINPSLDEANAKVDSITEFYRTAYPAVYAQKLSEISAAVEELKQVALLTTFPEMRVDYQTHSDNIGHSQSIGCFRCHGKLQASSGEKQGEMISKNCNLCHYNPGAESPLIPASAILHSIVGLQDCLSCHDAAGIKPYPSDHVGRSNSLCTSCHQPSEAAPMPPSTPILSPDIPHSIVGLPGCLSCHDSGSIKPYPANHVGRTEDLCTFCHKPSQVAAPSPAAPPAATPIPHSIGGLQDCYSCHGSWSFKPYPADHVGRTNTQCMLCHAPPQIVAGPPVSPPRAISIPHSITGLEDCYMCHGPGSVRPYPANHVGRSNTLCTICHIPSPTTQFPSSPPPAPSIPHSIVGRSNCLDCHNRSGEESFPSDHIGRTSTQCTICHRASN
jgi:hypothetical protein